MDIEKAQRLHKLQSLISEMVDYLDISDYLVESGILSHELNHSFQLRLETEGNATVMSNILAVINLRRGGFDQLIDILRKSDYIWIAEQLQLDSIPAARPSSISGKVMKAVCKRFSKQGEAEPHSEKKIVADTIFTSYRDTCPIDIPINPSFYDPVSTKNKEKNENDRFSAAGFINEGVQRCSTILQSFSLGESKDCEINNDNDDNHGTGHGNAAVAVVHNIISEHLNGDGSDKLASEGDYKTKTEEYLVNLAKRANVPSPAIKGLRVINKKKISKSNIKKRLKKMKKKRSKVNLAFSSEMARNQFVENVTKFIDSVQSTDSLYDSVCNIKVTIPISKCKKKNSMIGKKGTSFFKRKLK